MTTPAKNPSKKSDGPSAFIAKKNAVENCYLAIRKGGKTHEEAYALLMAIAANDDYATRQGCHAGRALLECEAHVARHSSRLGV